MKSARASEMRMRQPPLKSFVARCCISAEKPRPKRMRRALDSAAWAPMASSSEPTAARRSDVACWSSAARPPASSFAAKALSSARSALRSASARTTASTAQVSSAWTSCST